MLDIQTASLMHIAPQYGGSLVLLQGMVLGQVLGVVLWDGNRAGILGVVLAP